MAAENTVSTQYSNAVAPCSNNNDRVVWCQGAIASPEANDTIKMCKIPQGYRVVAVDYSTSAKIGDSGTFQLGVSDGTVSDADAISGNVTATAAVASAHLMVADPTLTAPGGTNAFTGDRYVYLTANGVGANPTAFTATMNVWMTPFTV